MLKKVMLLSLALGTVACSQGPGTSAGSDIEAQFIDDPVKGLEFVSASGSNGKTKALGKFKCKKGERVGFKIAGLELGEAICGEKIFVDDLISDDPNHSPEQVAAIIQSFAVAGTDELDLTTAVESMPANALAGLVFEANDADFKTSLEDKVDDIKVAVPALATVIEAKDPAQMRSILDAAIAAYSDLSDAFKAALASAAHDPALAYSSIPAEKVMSLTGKLSSNDPNDECYDFVQAKVSVSQEATGKPFKFVVHKVASFDALDAYNPLTNLCRDTNWCDQGTEMPEPKLISSSSINFFSKMEMSDSSGSWSSETVAVLNGSVVNGELVVQGSFSEVGSYTDSDGESGTFACKYTVTSADVAIPDEGPMSEDGSDAIDPADGDGTYSGVLDCTDNETPVASKNAVITQLGFVMTNITIGNNEVIMNNIDLVNDTETPDDNPFLQAYVNGVDSTDGQVSGYEEWGNTGATGYNFNYNNGSLSCSGLLFIQ